MKNETTGTAAPDDMLPEGPQSGRCDVREFLPGLDAGKWRCGRMACHVGAHAFHPEFHEDLGPVIRAARARGEAR